MKLMLTLGLLTVGLLGMTKANDFYHCECKQDKPWNTNRCCSAVSGDLDDEECYFPKMTAQHGQFIECCGGNSDMYYGCSD